MLDLPPVTEAHAEDVRGRPIGVLADPEYADEDLPNAEARLMEGVVAGLFVPQGAVEFDGLPLHPHPPPLLCPPAAPPPPPLSPLQAAPRQLDEAAEGVQEPHLLDR